MAVQILCLGCGVSIEAEESANWEVVPCFSCRAPLRMPVARQKLAGGPTLDSSADKPLSTPVVPNKPSKPVAPVKPPALEPPPFVPVAPVPLSLGPEPAPTPVSSSNVELAPRSVGSVRPLSLDEDKPVERRSDKGGGTGFKFKLVLGYFLFVMIPLAASIVVGVKYYNRMVENKPQSEVAQVPPEDPPVPKKDKPDPKPPVNLPMLSPEGFRSEWEKVGPVEVRIGGVAIRHIPIINAEKLLADSPTPVLAIWVETRMTSADKTIEPSRWQSPSGETCRLTTDGNEELHRASLGPGAIFRASIPSKQPLGLNSPPRVELLVFTPPSDEVKSLTLSLDAAHVGEVGKIELMIPASAWKK